MFSYLLFLIKLIYNNPGLKYMQLKEIMNKQNFVVVGNTINEDKYAYKIKKAYKIVATMFWPLVRNYNQLMM